MNVKVGFSTHYNNLLSWVIRKLTKCPASHTWLLLENSFCGRDMVLEANEVGYRLIPFDIFKQRNAVVAIKTPKYDLAKGVEVQIQKIGDSYDFPGLFGSFFVVMGRWFKTKWSNPFNHSKAMFCSEAIMEAMRACNYPGSERYESSSTTPGDLLDFFESEGI